MRTVNEDMMEFIHGQLIRRMNDPRYVIKSTDTLESLFGRGKQDVKEFIIAFNRKIVRYPKLANNKLRYSKNLTYGKVLTKFIDNYEQIKIHKSKESNYSE